MRRLRLRAVGPLVLLLVGGAYAIASGPWCGEWTTGAPVVRERGAADGPLLAGAASTEIAPPYPVVVAGYGPWRSTASRADEPLRARALVLQVQAVRVGWVELDALTAPESLVQAIRARVPGPVWVTASHTHSGMGGYDPRLISELAGTGRYRQDCADALVNAAVDALSRAGAQLRPTTLEVSNGDLGERVRSRDPGEPVDTRITHARIRASDDTVAEIDVLAAHPTLVPRRTEVLDSDYPGRVASNVLVIQGAGGNASTAAPDFAVPPAEGWSPPSSTVHLAYARVETSLPRPDSTRLVGSFASAAGDNFLCASAPSVAEVDRLELGPLTFVSVPGEPTFAAARTIEEAAHASRVVSLTNGYLGYVDTEENVRAVRGEARRQYFSSELLRILREAARGP